MKPVDYYDTIASGYNAHVLKKPYETYRFDCITKKILSALPKKKGLKVLDVGCGTGEFTFSVLSKILEKPKLVGTDFSKGMIDVCKKNFPEFSFKVMDIQDLTFKDSTFDVVLSRQMLEHVPNPLKAVKEMHRVLKPGGTLILSTPSWFGPIAPFYFAKKATGTMQPIDNWWTPFNLKRTFRKAGFKNVKFTSVCFIPYHHILPTMFLPVVKATDRVIALFWFSRYFGRTLVFKAVK